MPCRAKASRTGNAQILAAKWLVLGPLRQPCASSHSRQSALPVAAASSQVWSLTSLRVEGSLNKQVECTNSSTVTVAWSASLLRTHSWTKSHPGQPDEILLIGSPLKLALSRCK